jgi:hypothetical protein
MGIQGPFPDGGHMIICNECGAAITCFDLAEIFGDLDKIELKKVKEKFNSYENFICSGCLPFVKGKKKDFDFQSFKEILSRYVIEWDFQKLEEQNK